MPERLLPPHGGYRRLLSYQRAVLVYDATVRFCRRFLRRGDRTVDQMVQAARSGKQNIVEASLASGASKEMELRLTGVARASLEELAEDYRDFLRLHGAAEWDRQHPMARELSRLLREGDGAGAKVLGLLEHPDAATAANAILGLTKVTCYLLDRQIRRLERDFVAQGGIRERMTRARLDHRRRQGR